MDNKRRLLPLGLPLLALVVAAPAYAAVSYSYNTAGLSLSVTGDAANDLFALALDPNVHIQEVKAATCDIRPGRRPRGPARRDLVDQHARGHDPSGRSEP